MNIFKTGQNSLFVGKIPSALLLTTLISACGGGGGGSNPNPNPNPNPTPNVAPTVNAGNDQSVDEQTIVNLSGSANDTDGTITSYTWQQTAGSNVTINDASSANASFTAPDINSDETLTFSLTVSDNDGATATDSINIQVVKVNQPPTVSAGEDQTVNEQTQVNLQSTSNDTDGTITSYTWQQTAGSNVTINDANSANASFTAPDINSDETLTFSLTVSDNDGATATDSINIQVVKVNQPPTVSAGEDQTVNEQTQVNLLSTANDIDGSITSFNWQQTTGTSVNLTNSDSANASFIAPNVNINETLTFTITVTDSDGATASDDISINVQNVNQSPSVNAGEDQTVEEITQVTMSASANDPDGNITSFAWRQTQGSTVTLTNSDSSETSFIAPDIIADETLSFEVTATDNNGATATDSININVQWINTAPSVFAGEDQTVVEQKTVTLTGSVTDEENAIDSILWQQTGGTPVTLTNADSPAVSFTAPSIASTQTLTFSLTATDTSSASTSDHITITVTPITQLEDLVIADESLGRCINQNALQNNWANVSQATTLYCDHNQTITTLDGIEDLSALTSITLINANGDKLMNTLDLSPLSQLTQLTNLSLSHFTISNIEPFEQLTALEQLTLKHSALSQLENLDWLQQLSKLKHLDLSHNALSSISSLNALNNLNHLNLSSNDFTALGTISEFTQLTELNLSSNPLVLPTGIENLTNLTKLWLNNINAIQLADLAALTQLVELSYNDNKISSYGLINLFSIPQLQSLSMSNNLLDSIGTVYSSLNSLTHLDLSNNRISSSGALKDLTTLTALNLGNNQIGDTQFDWIENMTQLSELNLDSNGLFYIEALQALVSRLGDIEISLKDNGSGYCHKYDSLSREINVTLSYDACLEWQQDWQYQLASTITSPVAIDQQNNSYFGTADNRLYAIDNQGQLQWTFSTNSAIKSAPTIANDGTIYFGSDDHNFYALNADGSEKWRFATNGPISASAALASDGTIYIGNDTNQLYALNASGEAQWQYQTVAPKIHHIAIADNGNLYFSSEENLITALNSAGQVQWHYAIEQVSNPVIGNDGSIYAIGPQGLYKLNSNGELIWHNQQLTHYYSFINSFEHDPQDLNTPIIGSDGTIYVSFGGLFAVNPDSSIRWYRAEFSQQQALAPLASKQIITAYNDNIKGYDNGANPWSIPFGATMPLAMDTSGHVYLVQTNTLSKISTDNTGPDESSWAQFGRTDNNQQRVDSVTADTNQAPNITVSDDIEVNQGDSVTLTATATDNDGTISDITWVQTRGLPLNFTQAADNSITFTLDVGDYHFTATATDDQGAKSSDGVAVKANLISDTQAIITMPENFSVDELTQHTMTADVDTNGGFISYLRWSQVSGPAATLGNTSEQSLTFTAPNVDQNATMVFEFVAKNSSQPESKGRVTVNVNRINETPIISNLNDANIAANTQVTLTAAATDSDGTVAGYQWQQVAGTNVTLTGDTSNSLSFTTPDSNEKQTLTFRLTVSDNEGGQATRDVNIFVHSPLLIADVEIPDSWLRTCVDQAANFYGWTRVDEFTTMGCNSVPIETLTGLEVFTEVTSLHIYDTGLTNINPLASLSKLQQLNLKQNSIDDISALSNLNELASLDLKQNPLTQVSSLPAMAKLTTLDISQSQLTAMPNISLVSALTELDASNSNIQDISALANNTQLTSLDLTNNQIYDISSLYSLTNTHIKLSGNGVISCEDVHTLTTSLVTGSVDLPPCDSSAGNWVYQGINAASILATSSDGTIYASTLHYLLALTPAGTLKWKANVSNVKAVSIDSDGTIYTTRTAGPNNFSFISAITNQGQIKWRYEVNDLVTHAPVISSNGTLYLAEDGTDENYGKLWALNSNDGSLKWQYRSPEYIDSIPAISSDGSIHFSSKTSLIALNPDATEKWNVAVDKNIWTDHHNAIDSQDTVYFPNGAGSLYAIDSQGNQQWVFTGSSRVSSPIIDNQGNVLVRDNNNLYSLDAATGTTNWTYTSEQDLTGQLVIAADDSIYVGIDGELHAIKRSDNTTTVTNINRLKVENVTTPLIASNGYVYINAYEQIHAIATNNGGIGNSVWPRVGGHQNNANSQQVITTGEAPTNLDLPIVNIGENLIGNAGTTLALSSSVSAQYQIERYLWTQDNGSQASFDNLHLANANITLPQVTSDERITVRLTVVDQHGNLGSDTLDIIVLAPTSNELITTLEQNAQMMVANASTNNNDEQPQQSALMVTTAQSQIKPVDDLPIYDRQRISIESLYFDDKALHQCINQFAALNQWHYVDQMNSLTCDMSQLSYSMMSLNDIEQLTALKRLTLIDNLRDSNTLDLLPLSMLNSLEQLTISGWRLQNLNQLVALEKLTELTLNHNMLQDPSDISLFEHLEALDLDHNPIEYQQLEALIESL